MDIFDHFWQFLEFWVFSKNFFGFFGGIIFGSFGILDFLDCFKLFENFWIFFLDFFGFWKFLSKLLRLVLKVTKVKQHYKLFLCLKGKKAKGRSPPQELEVGPRNGPYLLVLNKTVYLRPSQFVWRKVKIRSSVSNPFLIN